MGTHGAGTPPSWWSKRGDKKRLLQNPAHGRALLQQLPPPWCGGQNSDKGSLFFCGNLSRLAPEQCWGVAIRIFGHSGLQPTHMSSWGGAGWSRSCDPPSPPAHPSMIRLS